MAWCLRFVRKLKQRLRDNAELGINEQSDTALTGPEMKAAKTTLVKLYQRCFSTEYVKSMDNTCKLFKDSDGLWRARGRLGSSELEDSTKFPVFIFPNSDIARLIIEEAHGKYHNGIAHIMATVRLEYWIPRLRQKARKLRQNCVRCKRFNSSPYGYPPMPDLPAQRVQQCQLPTYRVGIFRHSRSEGERCPDESLRVYFYARDHSYDSFRSGDQYRNRDNSQCAEKIFFKASCSFFHNLRQRSNIPIY